VSHSTAESSKNHISTQLKENGTLNRAIKPLNWMIVALAIELIEEGIQFVNKSLKVSKQDSSA
jgi:hypothetical protein